MSASLPVPTALGRVIDLNYPSNRWAVLGSVGTMVACKVAGRSWANSVRVGLSGFGAWALARELDPDAAWTANATPPLAALASFLAGEETEDTEELAALLPAFTTLTALRYATGSTGETPRWYDHVALTGASLLTGQSGQHAQALLPALGAGASLTAQDGQEPPAWVVVLAALTALLPQGWPEAPDLRGQPHSQPPVVNLLTGAALLLSPFLLSRERVKSTMDNGEGKVSAERVQAARVTAVLGVGLGSSGGEGRTALPLAAASTVIALRRVLKI